MNFPKQLILGALLALPLLSACQAPPMALSGLPAAATVGSAFDHRDFSTILAKYVRYGRIDYGTLKTNAPDHQLFDAYLAKMGTANVTSFGKADHYAFWVNSYNAFNIKAVLDNWPLKSPKDVDGYFDKLKYRVAGKDLTLDDMENVELIPYQNDGRAHFVVVGANNGSLTLEPTAATPANLDALLDKKTREFAADPRHFNVDVLNRVVYVSKLFDWYDKDFKKDAKFNGRRAVEYMIPYVDPGKARFLMTSEYTVVYTDWDWSVNDVNRK